jgi:hypothetical protein
MGMKTMSPETTKHFTKLLGPPQKCNLLDLGEILLDSVVNMLSVSERYNKGEKPLAILTGADPISEAIAEAQDLKDYQDLTYVGLPQPDKIERNQYMLRLRKCITELEVIKDNLPKTSNHYKSISISLVNLKTIKASFINRMKGEARPSPIAYVILGPPGIGKSSIIEMICHLWCKVKGVDYTPAMVYHRQSMEEYWSGYDPQSQPIIHLSEAGAVHHSIVKNQGDNCIKELLSIIDNLPVHLNMPSLEDKGNVMAIPELVVTDTNNPSLNAEYALEAPAALRRRFLYIQPLVKKEFRAGDSCRLDQGKALASESKPLDRWYFRISKMEPVDNRESRVITIKEGINVYELCDYIKEDITRHIEEQEKRLGLSSAINIDDYIGQDVESSSEESDDSDENYPESACSDSNSEVEEEAKLQSESMIILREQEEVIVAATVSGFCIFVFIKYFFHYVKRFFKGCFFYLSHYRIFLRLLWLLLKYSFFVSLSVINWFWPLKSWQKLGAIYSLKHSFQHLDLCWEREVLRFEITVLGRDKETEELKPLFNNVPYEQCLYVAAFGAILLLYRTMKPVLGKSEGMMVSRKRDGGEIDEAVRLIEANVNAQMPPKRLKKPNTTNWDLEYKLPITVNQANTQPVENVKNAIRRNLRNVIVTKGNNEDSVTRALGIQGDYALINKHALPPGFLGIGVADLNSLKITETIVSSELSVVPVAGDIVLVKLRGVQFKNILNYICEDIIPPKGIGYEAYHLDNKVRAYPMKSKHVESPYGDFWLENPMKYLLKGHCIGMCGTPIVAALANSFQVVGLHTAGDIKGDFAYAESVTRDMVVRALDKARDINPFIEINSEGYIRLPEGMSLSANIDPRSPINFEECSTFKGVAHIEGYKAPRPGKSKLTESPLLPYAQMLTGHPVCDEEGKPYYCKPPFKHAWVDGEYKAPFNHFVKKTGVLKKSLDPDIMVKTTTYLTDLITARLRQVGVVKLDPVPLDVAVNGHPEDFYMRSMKPSTSGGWAWPGPKKKYSKPVEKDFKKDAFEPIEEIKEQCIEQINAYEAYDNANPLNGAQLKDEPRPYEKVIERKTRVFCMSSYESTIVNRMYLMPFYSLMVEHSDIFYAALGIDMHSPEVDDLMKSMLGFSHLFMEGDYGGYDTSMPVDVGLMANTIVYNVLKNLGYNKDALQKVQGCLSDNLYPYIVLEGEIMKIPGFQPSGKYATAEDNSLRGLCLLVYAWNFLNQVNGTDLDFATYVKPLIYGDDMLASVKPEAADFFNNIMYQMACTKLFGMEFTNAQKTSDMQPFLTVNEISFLKRNFVYREDLGRYVAPLDLKSVMKTICYYLPSKEVTQEEQIIDSCVSAMRELFFHLDEKEFQQRRELFIRTLLKIYDVEEEPLRAKFPSFGAISSSVNPQEKLVSEAGFFDGAKSIFKSQLPTISSFKEKLKEVKKKLPPFRKPIIQDMYPDKEINPLTISTHFYNGLVETFGVYYVRGDTKFMTFKLSATKFVIAMYVNGYYYWKYYDMNWEEARKEFYSFCRSPFSTTVNNYFVSLFAANWTMYISIPVVLVSMPVLYVLPPLGSRIAFNLLVSGLIAPVFEEYAKERFKCGVMFGVIEYFAYVSRFGYTPQIMIIRLPALYMHVTNTAIHPRARVMRHTTFNFVVLTTECILCHVLA